MREERLKEIFSGKLNIDAFLKENPLGVLSVVRYSAETGQPLTAPMLEGMEKAKKIRLSGKEAGEELSRILMAEPTHIGFLQMTGILPWVLPELSACFSLPQRNPYHVYSVWEHTLKVLGKVSANHALRWAALLHDTGKSRTHTVDMYGVDHFHGHETASVRIAENILKRLEIEEKETILMLISLHDEEITSAEEWIEKIGKENFLFLLELKEADIAAKSPHIYESSMEKLSRLRMEASK